MENRWSGLTPKLGGARKQSGTFQRRNGLEPQTLTNEGHGTVLIPLCVGGMKETKRISESKHVILKTHYWVFLQNVLKQATPCHLTSVVPSALRPPGPHSHRCCRNESHAVEPCQVARTPSPKAGTIARPGCVVDSRRLCVRDPSKGPGVADPSRFGAVLEATPPGFTRNHRPKVAGCWGLIWKQHSPATQLPAVWGCVGNCTAL